MDDLWWALLLSDSAFPGGSLANSHGLESALKHGAVRRDDPDCSSLLRYIDMSLEQVSLAWKVDLSTPILIYRN